MEDDETTHPMSEGTIEPEQERVPRTIGRFEIHSLLGRGGMARVYVASDPTLDRLVALKVLHTPRSADEGENERQRTRILREARAAASFTHPNTVTIYEVGEADGLPFMAMELLDGTTLRAAAKKDVPRATRLRWLLEAARALNTAHARHLVHRDVKPENMIVDAEGRLKLLDFGIAKRDYGEVEAALAAAGIAPPEGPSSMRTVAGRRGAGTPRYMAPEQHAGESTDARTDQFAWGLVAFELLSGDMPKPDEDVAATLRSSGVPEPIVAAIVRALAPRKEDRAPSLQLAIDALEQDHTETKKPSLEHGKLARVAAGVLLLALASFGVHRFVQWRAAERALALAGPPSNCRIASSRTIPGVSPTNLVVLPAGGVIGSYTADRTDAPPSRLSLSNVTLKLDDDMLAIFRDGFFRSTTTPAGKPLLVALINQTPRPMTESSLVQFWFDEGKTYGGGRIPFTVSGIALAALGTGAVAALTYRHALTPEAPTLRFGAGLIWYRGFGEPMLKTELHVSSNGQPDSPAVAVSTDRLAMVFRDLQGLTVAFVDHRLERAGDPITVARGVVGAPAALYVGGALVVVWPETVDGKTRLRTASLPPGASAFEKSRVVVDDPVGLGAPVFTPLANGGALLTWIRSGPDGAIVRSARFASEISRPLDLGRASSAHGLAGSPEGDGASIGWVDPTARDVVVAAVACAR